MASSPSKLSLDSTTHMALKSFGSQNSDQSYKVEEIISQLEEERLKIDAFKRELPLCMQLLTNAMEASRQQLEVFKVNNQGTRPVLEEFIPIKHSTYKSCSSEKETNITDNKADWMTSAQLWSQASEGTKQQPNTIITSFPKEAAENIGFSMSPSLVLNHNNKQGNHNGGGGAFLPFSKERNSSQISALRALPELALASADKEIVDKKCEEPCLKMENSSNGGTNGMVVGKGPSHAQNTTTAATTQTHRKARRCWSPELHRRFVNALQMLGGSQGIYTLQYNNLMLTD
ncbi:putative transcription regulator Homeodomain-LIKE family [Lupinus albus]|uniref:Putative transcription regulator Homeodomain-LIKE family n=1 Tax=Lupinus albus TaxID=3870 RepID=A0A6A4PK43_LUPAL|nr:putative transcription regulator Homeodomain-LIKE family [Lupinus albus]